MILTKESTMQAPVQRNTSGHNSMQVIYIIQGFIKHGCLLK